MGSEMARYLIAAWVGPVQDFIAAARRTRDLWFGSYVLSSLSKAAAEGLSAPQYRGQLIFPADAAADRIANVLLAEIETDDPAGAASSARNAVRSKWRETADDALKGIQHCVEPARWHQQVDDVVEFCAAWVPFPDDQDYLVQRKRVMRLLDARKACRDFAPSLERDMRVRKSSLDGARETVLKKPADNERPYGKLRLNTGEQLDVVGLTKRQGGGRKAYPSVSRIAADPWLRGLASDEGERLQTACAKLPGVNRVSDCPQFNHFPFDGTMVYASRHKELLEEAEEENKEALKAGLRNLALPKLYATAGEPSPYLAILAADGDGIGKLISSMETAGAHRDFSRKLAEFAGFAKRIVEEQQGVLIYAGGDDVLALVSVDRAVECAQRLAASFHEVTGASLSVGIAIGHFMEPLEDLRQYAQEAEKNAKGKTLAEDERGNGLSIHLHTRGGAPIRIRGRWDSGFAERILYMAKLYEADKLADKSGYDLESLARKYLSGKRRTDKEKSREREETPAWLAEALPGEAAFVLQRKRGGTRAAEVHKVLRDATTPARLLHNAEELIVARRLASAMREAKGTGPARVEAA